MTALALRPDPGGLVAVLFPGTRFAGLPAAVALAGGADKCVRISSPHGPATFWVEFGRSPAQASVAAALLGLIGSRPGVVVFLGGRPVGQAWGAVQTAERVMRCYAGACTLPDPRASCWSVSTSLFSDGAPHPPALFPCRHILRMVPSPLSRGLPVSEVDQVAARAVDAGCASCPLFDQTAFRFLTD